ncbi:uncharacterized protein LOC18032216 isoform X2 [Citrus clementina]|uniref:uncharacterized protein LOC18032216 isoform X2 n=1 Tax=Citrus clementina TaxID=85681 RepID=UPI000CED3BD4|nr:uncharacterized protein LOC18032216 isoform X2 [Citrus x clementina]
MTCASANLKLGGCLTRSLFVILDSLLFFFFCQIGLLSLVWNVAGYMAGIAMVLEDGGYVAGITVGWRVTGYVAIRVLPLEEGIATGSLAVGVFPLIFESFVG